MAPTLRRVVAIAPLHLTVLAGRRHLDRPVRWVAVSELEDPTPFLEGGELVLTTGMRLSGADAGPYIDRLVARGVAGFGFGVGLTHDRVPREFIDAAEAAGLPLVEVPRETPFIAIGKAVSELLAAEQYEELSRAFAAQGRLTRAALQRDGTAAVVDRLAKEVDGWVILFDQVGAVRRAADASAPAAGRADGRCSERVERAARSLEPELARFRRAQSPASLALSTPDEHVIVHPLGRKGFLAVGSERPFTPNGHTIVNAAGSLLTLTLEQGREQRTAAARVRSAALRLLLTGETEAAGEVLAALGERLPDPPYIVLACAAGDEKAGAAELEELAEALPCFTAPWEGMLLAIAPASAADDIAAIAARHGRVGLSAEGADLPTAVDQAKRALAAASPVARFADLAGQGLLSLLDPAAAASFAAAILAPLREYGRRTDLVESLRAYLACNGHWDAAAHRLGIHRHTLRYRMKRVSELLGRDLDDPGARAELWIALNV